jgi:parallel beta-helix repeat protein
MKTLGTFAVLCSLITGLANAKDIKVKPGQKIQDVIDGASPGDHITVPKGIYYEQLTITKKLQLLGQNGAVIMPPAPEATVTNLCSGLAGPGTQAGICISGSGIEFSTEPFDGEHVKVNKVLTPVEDVLVKGFEVKGFDGLNIAVLGAKNAEVRENVVSDGTHYGILTVGSTSSLITRNTVGSSTLGPTLAIGICMDDKSDVSVTQNVISGYWIGLCVQTNKADVGHNKVSECCVGAYIDPFVDGAHVTHNQIIGSTNPNCVAIFLLAGIVVDGALNADIQHNDISGVTDGKNPDVPYLPPGIFVFNFSGFNASGNTIDFNNLSNNDMNIIYFTGGTNEIKHNTCINPTDNCNF